MLKELFLKSTKTIRQLVGPMDPVNQIVKLADGAFLSPDFVLDGIKTRLTINLGFESLSLMPK
jgi:hypothetical protein